MPLATSVRLPWKLFLYAMEVHEGLSNVFPISARLFAKPGHKLTFYLAPDRHYIYPIRTYPTAPCKVVLPRKTQLAPNFTKPFCVTHQHGARRILRSHRKPILVGVHFFCLPYF